jgi:YVTN family beta-propeller protein
MVRSLGWIIPLSSIVTLGMLSLRAPAGSTTAQGLLLITNKADRTLAIIDPDAGRELATIPEQGITGHEVAASPDGRTAYVPIYGNSGVGNPGTDGRKLTIIDIPSRRVTGQLDFGKGVRPHCAKFGPKDGLLYVTTELSDSVTIIDPRTQQIVGSVPTGQRESHMLAISSDGRHGYTANVGAGTVSVLDLEARKLITVIPICRVTQRISITPDDRMVFTADQRSPRLAVIDTATNKLKSWIALPAVAYGTAPTLDGRWLLVTQPEPAKVAVVDLHSLKVVRTIDVTSAPQEVLVRPDNRVAYVSCNRTRKVAAIDLENWKVEKFITAGRDCDGMAWAAAE